MGLDMFLNKQIGIYGMYDFENIAGEINLTKDGVTIPINLKKVQSITEEAMYWIKSNQIHRWFVENIQDGNDDCGRYEVSIDDLKNLLSICKEVNKDHTKAEELLPTGSGFFFGSLDYNEYYFNDIEETIKGLEEVIKDYEETPKGISISYTYESSW